MTDEPTVISGEQVREVLMALGVPVAGIFCLDATYRLLSETDVREKLRDGFTNQLIRTGDKWIDSAHDCENFAIDLWSYTARMHAKQKDEGGKCGVAFGLMTNAELGHAFCFAIHRSDAGVLYPCAYEPQRDASGFSCGQIAVPWAASFLCVC